MSAEERAEIAARLRHEAATLLGESGLFALLQQRFGEAAVTGSAGYDLMVWRDIDIHLPVEADGWAEWAGLGGEMAQCLHMAGLVLYRAGFLNDYVAPQPLGPGLRWELELRDGAGEAWSCEIWGWEPFDYAVRQARDSNLRADLATADRDLILRLKHEARARPGYHGKVVTSHDIYQFAIAGAGESLEELEAWKASL